VVVTQAWPSSSWTAGRLGRARVRAATAKTRRARFVDLPLTIAEGREVVKPEVVQLLEGWLRLRSQADPRLGEEDALFVTLGPHGPEQWARPQRTGPGARLPKGVCAPTRCGRC